MTTRILVTYGSKRGGTAEIASAIATTLRARGFEVDCAPVERAPDLATYDAVIIGGALYVARWIRSARRYVREHADALRGKPVWMFSSGPLDDSASATLIPPVHGVAAMMRSIGARGHITFGGRLSPDAKGFIASAMAKKSAGDWRDWGQVRRWAAEIATALEVSAAAA